MGLQTGKIIMRKILLLNLLCWTAMVVAGSTEWELIWSDEFDRDGLPDKSKWDYEGGFVRNKEAQYYTSGRKENARVENGNLIIEARKEKFHNPLFNQNSGDWAKKSEFADYTSASVKSRASWLFGRIEMRARLPRGAGVWPAFWTLGTGGRWPQDGEIDIMEFVGKEPDKIYANIHYSKDGVHACKPGMLNVPSSGKDFHVYAAEWFPDRIDFYFDNNKYHTTWLEQTRSRELQPFGKPHYILINFALGGEWGGPLIDDSVLPQQYIIDYVRVYKARAASAPGMDSGSVTNIGSRLELFLDRKLLAKMTDALQLKINHPQIEKLPDSMPSSHYMTILRDGGKFRAYYRLIEPGSAGSNNEYTAISESNDGINWTSPNLGLCWNADSKNNNIIWAMGNVTHNFSPFIDSNPACSKDERFKALGGTDGLYALASADGIKFKMLKDSPVIPQRKEHIYSMDSQNVVFWSQAEKKYVCYYRVNILPDRRQLRSVARATSSDFIKWSEPELVGPNLTNEQMYTTQTHPYFRDPYWYIGTPTRIYEGRGNITDIALMASRSGERFSRTFPEALIRPGLESSRWLNRANYAALNIIQIDDSRMALYHARAKTRYLWRIDGLSSLCAGYEGGAAETTPVVFSGNTLQVNVSTAAGGDFSVEMLSVDGKTLAKSTVFYGDKIQYDVKWENNADIGIYSGTPVKLRFNLKDADLYSYRFYRK